MESWYSDEEHDKNFMLSQVSYLLGASSWEEDLIITDTKKNLVQVLYKGKVREDVDNEKQAEFELDKRRNKNLVLGDFLGKSSNELRKYDNIDPYNVRGWIIDINERAVVCRSHGNTSEFVCDSVEEFEKHAKKYEDEMFSEIIECTIIRVFTTHGKNEKNLSYSTHKKIEARKSTWDRIKTFGEMFDEASTRMGLDNTQLIDKDGEPGRCHIFSLVHENNQLTNQIKVEPTLYHLYTLVQEKDRDHNGLIRMKIDEDFKIENCDKLESFNYDEALKRFEEGKSVLVNSLDNPVRFITKKYHDTFQIRAGFTNPHPFVELTTYILRDKNMEMFLEDVVPPHQKERVRKTLQNMEQNDNDLVDFLFAVYEHEKKMGKEINITFYMRNILTSTSRMKHYDVKNNIRKVYNSKQGHVKYRLITDFNKMKSQIQNNGYNANTPEEIIENHKHTNIINTYELKNKK